MSLTFTDKNINEFLLKLSSKYEINSEELSNFWKKHNSSLKTEEESNKENIVDYSKCKLPELKSLCKKKGFKVSGTKADLLNRLLGKEEKIIEKSIDKKEKPKVDKKITKKEETIRKTEKNNKIEENAKVLDILKNDRPQIKIARNTFNNIEHKETGFVFNTDKIVIGKQNSNGNIDNLFEKDIEELNKWNFRYDSTSVSLHKQNNDSDSDLASDEYEEIETEEELEDEE